MIAVHLFRFPGFRVALLSLASLSLCSAAVACSSDDNHGPTIGAPTTPIVINEGGGSPGGGPGNPNGGTSAATGGVTGFAGSLSSGATAGSDPFGTGGTDPFGTGGTSTSGDPFGVGGTSSSTAGTFSSSSGTSSF